MISCSAVISRPVKTGETPPNEWDMAHVGPVHPVADTHGYASSWIAVSTGPDSTQLAG
jgi:hypothetical protein